MPVQQMFISFVDSLGFARACANRAGVGAWRSKRQVIWLIAALCIVLVVYAHFSPSTHISEENSLQRIHQSLKSVYRESANDAQTSKPPKVQFIPTKFIDSHSQDLNVKKSSSAPYFPINTKEKFLDYGDSKVKAQVNWNNNDYRPPIAPLGEQAYQNENSYQPVGSIWSSGYRYNPYGEPVYGKTARPNYIPNHRVVHFDFKGAPPKLSTLKILLPKLAQNGATAVLLEYEDMFPWHSQLAPLAAKNHYTAHEVKEIISVCKKHKLEIIPLVQTFGHLEHALKQQKFSHLREVPELPQALCPSLNGSMWLVKNMIEQIMELHEQVTYLHIGCDEVNQLGECERCRLVSREMLYLQHVMNVAKFVRTEYHSIPLVWDDVLRHISDESLRNSEIGELVEPVVWVYAEDIYRFMQPSTWTKFSEIFPKIWGASAFKGAFGEQLIVPNVHRHLDNNLNWLDVMATESSKFSGGFTGLILTGWQRYDHFAVLCELFPAAMPSLAVNLIATSHGYFNSSLQGKIYEALNCMSTPKYQTWLNLDADPYLWDKFSWCFFPGSQFFKITSRFDATKRDVEAYLHRVTKTRAWITEYNIKHNFSVATRISEDLEELPSRLHSVNMLLKTTRDALSEWFDDWTVGEWIELHIMPLVNSLQTLQRESESMKNVKYWQVRPFPILPELASYGITEKPITDKKIPTSKMRYEYIKNSV